MREQPKDAQEMLSQVTALRKQAEHLAFYRVADVLRCIEIELSFKLGVSIEKVHTYPCGFKKEN
jgi:hypothetical protein